MSTDKSAVRGERSSGRNWTEAEKDIVWEQACKAKQNDLPLTEAFRQVSRLLPHRSEAAVGMLYYNVLRKEREEPEIVKTAAPPSPKSQGKGAAREFRIDPDLIQAFQGLPEYIHQVNQRIEKLEQRIDKPSVEGIIQAMHQLTKNHLDNEELHKELNELRRLNETLERENDTLHKDLDKIKQAYDDAVGIYDMFTNMASISQIMSLGDFKQQMKTTLDKWGNVLDITFQRTT